eukprot:11256839-Alexandrium_andersonii.AAC.1
MCIRDSAPCVARARTHDVIAAAILVEMGSVHALHRRAGGVPVGATMHGRFAVRRVGAAGDI